MNDYKQEWLEKDFYKDLGVSSTAKQEEIDKKYRELVKRLHPDRNPNNKTAENRFKEVSAAYDVIGKKDTRGKYDEIRHTILQQQKQREHSRNWSNSRRQHGGFGHSNDSHENVSDFLEAVFGSSNNAEFRNRQGSSYELTLNISFDEAMQGGSREIHGVNEMVKIKIPKGVANKTSLVLRGKGGEGFNGGKNGDLLVVLTVGRDETYIRRGDDLSIEIAISYALAVMGGKAKVPTYKGKAVEINIPKGTKSGTKFRIKGHGVKFDKKSSGDLFAKIVIEIPEKLSAIQKKSLKEFDATLKK